MLRALKERLGRVRWLEWTNVVLWGLLGGFGYFYIPRLASIFASFGAELPNSTVILLRVRPIFIIPFGLAVLSAAYLALPPRKNPINPRWRPFLWANIAAALLAAYCTVSAIFAPMFCGGLSEVPERPAAQSGEAARRNHAE